MFKHKKLNPYLVSTIFTIDQLEHHVDWTLALLMTALSLLEQVLHEQELICEQKKTENDSRSIFNVVGIFEKVRDFLSSAEQASPLLKVHAVAFKQKIANIQLIMEEVVL